MSQYMNIVEYQGSRARVKFEDFNTLKSGVERKFGVSLSNVRLEYCDSGNEWIGIYEDEDLETITEQTKLRIIPKDSGASSKGMSLNAYGDQNRLANTYNENNKIEAGRIAGRDYIDGDKITARNMAKLEKFGGTMNIGDSTSNTFSGDVSGDSLHFGVGHNIKN